jgi:TFIIF-interacting CTD phosphatase-like protein
VLDLDETLVHSAFKEPERFDIKLPVSIDERDFIVYVQIRPGAF